MYRKYKFERMAEQTDQTTSPNMEYGFLSPGSGLKVSKICLGTMNFGNKPGNFLNFPGQTNESLAHQIMDRYAALGGNFLDSADIYGGPHETDRIVGTWLQKQQRENFVVATKCMFPTGSGPNDMGLSRHHIMNAVTKSLKALQTDYIDLYYVHSFDRKTPLRETLMTLNDLVRSGKVRYLGCSNHLGWHLQKALCMQQYMGLDKYIVTENQYNLLTRDGEYDAFDVCLEEGVGLVPWSPLKYGLLTNKYMDKKGKNETASSDTRQGYLNKDAHTKNFTGNMTFDDLKDNPDYWKLMDTLQTAGQAHGKNIAQVSLKWLIQKPPVSSVIIGPKTIAQLEDCMVGGDKDWKLTDEQMKEIEAASDFAKVVPAAFNTANAAKAMRNM